MIVISIISAVAGIIIVAPPRGRTSPVLFQSLAWIKNNTPKNATVLSMHTDGSIIEGFGNRIAYVDIWSSHQELSKIYNTSRFFLANNSTDQDFIDRVHPDYVFVRGYWYFIERGVLFSTANITYSDNYPLSRTNLNRLLFDCTYGCTFNNATLRKVFENNDDVVYKVYYKSK